MDNGENKNNEKALQDVKEFEELLKKRNINYYEKTERSMGKQKYIDIKISFKLA